MQAAKRLPIGTTFLGLVPLEACKAYPTRIWDGTGLAPRIAYADANTKHEHNDLLVNFLPEGNKSAPHPQIVLITRGAYHTETFLYEKTDPRSWSTWMEVHLDARLLDRLVDPLIRAKLILEGIQ